MSNLRHTVVETLKAVYAPRLPLHDALARPRYIASLGQRMLAHSALLVSVLSVVTVTLRVIVVAAGDTQTIYGILGSVSPLSLAVSMLLPMVASLIVILPAVSYALAAGATSITLRVFLRGVVPLATFVLTYFFSSKINWFTALVSFIVVVAFAARRARQDIDAGKEAEQQAIEKIKERCELGGRGSPPTLDPTVVSQIFKPMGVPQWLTRDEEIALALHELDAIKALTGRLPEKPGQYDPETLEALFSAVDLRYKVLDRWSEAIELERKAHTFTAAVILAAIFYLFALLAPPPYALEEIDIADEANVGYVIAEDSHWLILLDREDRMLRRIAQSEIDTRGFCRVRGDELFGQRRNYPDCPSR